MKQKKSQREPHNIILPILFLILSHAFSLMEFETKYKEDHTYPPILLPNNYLKPEIIEDEFSVDSYSSKGVYQDLNHFDQLSFAGPSSLNPEFGVDTTSFDPFDHFTFGSCSNDIDLYEFKPFEENGANGNSAVIQNFYSGGGYLNGKKTPVDLSASEQSLIPFQYQEIKPLNFVVPDEGSCIAARKGYCKEKYGLMKKNNSTASTKRASKSRKKSNSSKGQWTIEEDR